MVVSSQPQRAPWPAGRYGHKSQKRSITQDGVELRTGDLPDGGHLTMCTWRKRHETCYSITARR